MQSSVTNGVFAIALHEAQEKEEANQDTVEEIPK
jgi:hypothetical protein